MSNHLTEFIPLGRILSQNVWITQLKIGGFYSVGWTIKFCKIVILINRWNERMLLLTVVDIRFELLLLLLFLMGGCVVHTGTM